MNIVKMEAMYQLIADSNFQVSACVSDSFKCIKCKGILIDACQVPCGCRFCRRCVGQLIESGCQVCPGNSDECKDENLSNYVKDYRVNKEISKLVVKCPAGTCLFESELINLNEHLRVCSKKSLKCPFSEFGCDLGKLSPERMDEHLQSEGYSHMKILIDVIDNLRNEVDRLENAPGNRSEIEMLKRNEEAHKTEMEVLKRSSLANDNRIATLIEEVRVMRVEMNGLVETGALMRTEIDRLSAEAGAEVNRKVLLECQDSFRYQSAIMNTEFRKHRADIDSRLNAVERLVDKRVDGVLVWPIDGIGDKRKNREFVRSEYFYGSMKSYRLALAMYTNGLAEVIGTGLSICLVVYADARDPVLKWPLEADVTIKIVNKANLDLCVTATNRCQIRQPSRNEQTCSEQFQFTYDALADAGLLHGDGFVVECSVDVA